MDASAALTVADLALIGINPQDIALAYAWGFGAVISTWSLGYVVGIAVTLIRKI